MSPWWLRPSKEAADEAEPEPSAPAETSPEPAPEPEPAPRRDPGGARAPPSENQAAEQAAQEPRQEDDGDGDGDSDSEPTKTRSRSRSRSRRGGRSKSANGRGGNGARPSARAEESEEPRPARRRGRQNLPLADDLDVEDADNAIREFFVSLAEDRSGPAPTPSEERKIAIFCDLENVALGVRDSDIVKKFDINLVLERLLEKGKIIVKKAYCRLGAL